jgi:phage portal protein BeeE
MFDRISRAWTAGNTTPSATEARQLVQLVETLAGSPTEAITHDFESFVRRGYLSNGIVYGCITARLVLFAQGQFKMRNKKDQTVRDLPPRLVILDAPWPGGSTAEMLSRIEQDTSLAGNWYLNIAEPDLWQRLRPDWVTIVLDPAGLERVGYLYHRGGRGKDKAGLPLPLEEVIHGSPYPDPLAAFRGTSWIPSVTDEIQSDTAMTKHKGKFFANSATPNLLVKLQQSLSEPQREVWRDKLNAGFGGVGNAWKTLVLEDGADASIIGSAVDLGFTATQAGGENRIAVAAGVPSIVLGIKEGAEQATYNNYGSALGHMANFTTQHMWNDTTSVLTNVLPVPTGFELVIDKSDIPALQQDAQAEATVTETQARTIRDLVDGGFTHDSAIEAVTANDLTLLEEDADADPAAEAEEEIGGALSFISGGSTSP